MDPNKQAKYPYFSDIGQALVFLIIYHFTSKVFAAGWDLYTTFDLNERHCLNKQNSLGLFLRDFIKTTDLWIVLGGAAFYMIIIVVEWGGELFFLWLFLVSASFIFLYKYLYLNFISPTIFNKYDRLDPQKYKELIHDINCLHNNNSNFPNVKI